MYIEWNSSLYNMNLEDIICLGRNLKSVIKLQLFANNSIKLHMFRLFVNFDSFIHEIPYTPCCDRMVQGALVESKVSMVRCRHVF